MKILNIRDTKEGEPHHPAKILETREETDYNNYIITHNHFFVSNPSMLVDREASTEERREILKAVIEMSRKALGESEKVELSD